MLPIYHDVGICNLQLENVCRSVSEEDCWKLEQHLSDPNKISQFIHSTTHAKWWLRILLVFKQWTGRLCHRHGDWWCRSKWSAISTIEVINKVLHADFARHSIFWQELKYGANNDFLKKFIFNICYYTEEGKTQSDRSCLFVHSFACVCMMCARKLLKLWTDFDKIPSIKCQEKETHITLNVIHRSYI